MTYIFLTPELGTMGGSQMYVCNKSTYLRMKGWNVKIVYFTESELLIKKLGEFESIYAPELAWGVQYYLPSRVKKIINRLVSTLNISDTDVYIESCLFQLAFWGEMLASKLRAKHILHFLEEDIPSFSKRVSFFMEFKLSRWECMNASEKSLKRLFKTFYKPEYKNYEFKTDFFCSNVFQKSEIAIESNIHFEKADDTILSIGRLDKSYIQEMVEQVIKFSNKYNNRRINLVLIGGSPNGKSEKVIERTLMSVHNVRTYILGYLFPIPERIVKSANIAIATSNSVLIPYNLGIPTIAVDSNDHFAIGLYGIDTLHKVFRIDEMPVPIGEYLEKVLIKKDFPMYDTVIVMKSEDEILDEHFKGQVEYVRKTSNDGIYYNISDLYSCIDITRGILVRNYSRKKKQTLS